MATHSNILAWRILWKRSLAGYSPQGLKESDRTEHAYTHTHTHNLHIWRKWKNMKIQGPSFFLIKLSRKLFYMEVNPFVQTKWYACLKYFWNLIIKCLLEYGEKYLNRYITTLIVDFVIICLKVILNIYIL